MLVVVVVVIVIVIVVLVVVVVVVIVIVIVVLVVVVVVVIVIVIVVLVVVVVVIGERAKRVRHPLLLPIEKNVVYIVRTSKPQCACRSGRACIYEKPACYS